MARAELNGRYDGLVPLVPVPLPAGEIEAILDTGFALVGMALPRDAETVLAPAAGILRVRSGA